MSPHPLDATGERAPRASSSDCRRSSAGPMHGRGRSSQRRGARPAAETDIRPEKKKTQLSKKRALDAGSFALGGCEIVLATA